jgi:hypothetical protein
MGSVEVYDRSIGSWKVASSMHKPRANFAVAVVDDVNIMVIGGKIAE